MKQALIFASLLTLCALPEPASPSQPPSPPIGSNDRFPSLPNWLRQHIPPRFLRIYDAQHTSEWHAYYAQYRDMEWMNRFLSDQAWGMAEMQRRFPHVWQFIQEMAQYVVNGKRRLERGNGAAGVEARRFVDDGE